MEIDFLHNFERIRELANNDDEYLHLEEEFANCFTQLLPMLNNSQSPEADLIMRTIAAVWDMEMRIAELAAFSMVFPE